MESHASSDMGLAKRAQFIHVEHYAVKPSVKKSNGRSIQDIADEAERVPEACPHVPAPAQPILHFGVRPGAAKEMAAAWSKMQCTPYLHKATGRQNLRKRREDQPCALVGVVSVPPEFPASRWPEYISKTISWLKAKYDTCLKSVVEHTDEPHRHLHFWVVPKPGAKFSSVHQGLKAKEDVPVDSSRSYRDTAFAVQMSLYQDEFFAAVASAFELRRWSVWGQRFSPPMFGVYKAKRTAETKANEVLLAAVLKRENELKQELADARRQNEALDRELAELRAQAAAAAMQEAIRTTQAGSRAQQPTQLSATQAAPAPDTTAPASTPTQAQSQEAKAQAPAPEPPKPPTPFDDMRRPRRPAPP